MSEASSSFLAFCLSSVQPIRLTSWERASAWTEGRFKVRITLFSFTIYPFIPKIGSFKKDKAVAFSQSART